MWYVRITFWNFDHLERWLILTVKWIVCAALGILIKRRDDGAQKLIFFGFINHSSFLFSPMWDSERILFYCIPFYNVQCVAPVINWHLAQKLSLTFQDYQWTSMFSTLPPQPSGAFAEGDGQSEARAVWGGDHLLQWHRGVYNPLPLQHPHGGGGHAQRHLQELWQHTWPPWRLQGICGQNAGRGQFRSHDMQNVTLLFVFSQQCHA